MYYTHNKIFVRTPLRAYSSISNILSNENEFLEFLKTSSIEAEALFIASPDLFTAKQNLLLGKITDKNQRLKVINALVRYFLRMSYRPTPYGYFAGVSTSKYTTTRDNEFSSIILKNRSNYKRFLSLDYKVLTSIIYKLEQEEIIKNEIKYYTNNTIIKIGNKYRYISYDANDKNEIKHKLSEFEANELLDQIISYSKHGASIAFLLKSILENFNYDAVEEIELLIKKKILVSELHLNATGINPFQRILNILNDLQLKTSFSIKLESIYKLISEINSNPIWGENSKYINIINILDDLKISYEPNKTLQAVLTKQLKSCLLSRKVIREASNAINLISKLNYGLNDIESLIEFKEAFYNRYGDREVMLLEAIDQESGIGFPIGNKMYSNQPLIENLVTDTKRIESNSVNYKINPILLNKIIRANEDDLLEIEISENDLREIKDKVALPNSFFSIIKLYYDGNYQKIVLQAAGGASAKEILGRFCNADKLLLDTCLEIASHEKLMVDDAIIAEIVHLPESRMGNIIYRPILSEYEIPILTKSVLSVDKQIFLSDLMISIQNNEIILRSKRLNKRVYPTLSSAHNFTFNSLPVYNFLCTLQYQNAHTPMTFSWGDIENVFSFLPRVVYGNVILSPAKWIFTKNDYKTIIDSDELELFKKIDEWRKKYKIPKQIAISDSDNELYIDLTNKLCINVLQEELKKREKVTLVECFINFEKSVSEDENGELFNHEIVLSFLNSENNNSTIKHWNNQSRIIVQSDFLPGEEWVYFKIYCGASVANKIISEVLYKYTIQLIELEKITQWFFVRYADPDNHVRVRMKLSSFDFFGEIVRKLRFLLKPYFSTNQIVSIQIDTYKREVERYTATSIEDIEKLFYLDSKLVASLIAMGIQSDKIWILAIYGVHRILTDFNFDLKDKMKLLLQLKEKFYKEHNLNENKLSRKKINNKFRENRNDVLNTIHENHYLVKSTKYLFDQKSEYSKLLIGNILNQHNIDVVLDLVSSIIHMHLNRFFESNQRLNETIIYYYLYKIYDYQININKKNTP